MRGNAIRIMPLALAALGLGCAEAGTVLSAGEEAGPAFTVSPAVYVLNTQLRGIIDPDITPTPAWGHVQLKLTDDDEEGYRVEWKGKIFNPKNEVFTSAVIINPDIIPTSAHGDGDPPIVIGRVVYRLFNTSTQSCGILLLDSQGITDEEHMPADIAQAMIINPEIHQLIVVSSSGGVMAGRFGLPDPQTALGFNPQPDPPGRISRCAAVS